jgi:hypothetical protein
MILTEPREIRHVDCETGEKADDDVQGLEGGPYSTDFGVDGGGAVDEGSASVGDDDGLKRVGGDVSGRLR